MERSGRAKRCVFTVNVDPIITLILVLSRDLLQKLSFGFLIDDLAAHFKGLTLN